MKVYVIKRNDGKYYNENSGTFDERIYLATFDIEEYYAVKTASYQSPKFNWEEDFKVVPVTIAEGDLEQENKKLCQNIIELNTDNNRLIKENNEINLRLLRSDTYRLSSTNVYLRNENQKLKRKVEELKQKLKDIRKLANKILKKNCILCIIKIQ